MYRNYILAALVVCAMLTISCEKEELLTTEKTETLQNAPSQDQSSMRLGDFVTTTNIDDPATYKGMYVDGANNIIRNSTKETNLINYAVDKGINTLTFYGLKSVIASSSNYSKMASFLSRCSQNGITNFVYVIVYYPGSVNGLD